MGRLRVDPWLLAVTAVSTGLCLYQLDWGLPNGNASWAADALGPLTVLSIARRSVGTWNSGWFYFKYPLGYPLLQLLAFAPYLAWLWLTGGWRNPRPRYPYGFADPDGVLLALALLGRLLSVACIVATVVLAYDLGRRLYGRVAGRLAAGFAATAYPLIYYAHTTNLDAAYLFWLILALWATVVASAGGQRWPYVVLGIAAAMVVSTKEQGFAFLLPLPLMIAAARQHALVEQLPGWRRWWAAVWNGGTRAGLLVCVATMAVANNWLLNPSGFLNRLRYLSGQQVPGFEARLAPVEFALFKGIPKEWLYVRQLGDALESALGWPLLATAAVGAVYLAWRRPKPTAMLLAPAVVQYYLSLRTLDLITLRYTLPLMVVAALCAGALVASWLEASGRRVRVARWAVAALCLLSFARAIELEWLLRTDSRYQAEAWLAATVPADARVEVYQKPAYLPRAMGRNVSLIPLAERTIAALDERRPDIIITSSAAKQGITHRWNPDWKNGEGLLQAGTGAPEFLVALEGEQLPYRQVATFAQASWLLRVRITSLRPTISIYRRRVD